MEKTLELDDDINDENVPVSSTDGVNVGISSLAVHEGFGDLDKVAAGEIRKRLKQ